MSRTVTRDDLFKILKGYEDDIRRVQKVISELPNPKKILVDINNATRFGVGGDLNSDLVNRAQVRVNYDNATNRLIDTTKPGWIFSLGDGANDRVAIWRAPPTAGAPAFGVAWSLGSDSIPRFLGGLGLFGDIDTAKWMQWLGGFRTTWGSDSGSAASLGTGDRTVAGRTFKPKMDLDGSGNLRTAGSITQAGQTVVDTPAMNTAIARVAQGFSGYRNAAQTVNHNTWTTIQCDVELYDTHGVFDVVTNKGRFLPNIAGWYEISGFAMWTAAVAGAGEFSVMEVWKNGASVGRLDHSVGASDRSLSGSIQVFLNGTTDYVEVQLYQTKGDGTARTLHTHSTAPDVRARVEGHRVA